MKRNAALDGRRCRFVLLLLLLHSSRYVRSQSENGRSWPTLIFESFRLLSRERKLMNDDLSV
jgi:hypothetical protein